MSELVAYGTEVNNIFQLIGNLENDITKSIAWALARCPEFLKAVINEVMSLEIDAQMLGLSIRNLRRIKV